MTNAAHAPAPPEREHTYEAVRGLPETLPEGEKILWQGEPLWTSLAKRVFHVPLVAAYFLALALWRIADGVMNNAGLPTALSAAIPIGVMAALAIGLLSAIAWVTAKTTVYTITSKRVVFRIGAALTKAINIPFKIVETAGVKKHGGSTGDIAFDLRRPNKIGYFHLWPHARPDKLRQPQATFRCIAEPEHVAGILGRAMEEDLGQGRTAVGVDNKTSGDVAPEAAAAFAE